MNGIDLSHPSPLGMQRRDRWAIMPMASSGDGRGLSTRLAPASTTRRRPGPNVLGHGAAGKRMVLVNDTAARPPVRRRLGASLRLLWRNNISGPSDHRRFRHRYMAVWIEERRDPSTFPRRGTLTLADIEQSMERARKSIAASTLVAGQITSNRTE